MTQVTGRVTKGLQGIEPLLPCPWIACDTPYRMGMWGFNLSLLWIWGLFAMLIHGNLNSDT